MEQETIKITDTTPPEKIKSTSQLLHVEHNFSETKETEATYQRKKNPFL